MGLRVQGSGFGVCGLVFRVWGLGLGIHNSGIRASGLEFGVYPESEDFGYGGCLVHRTGLVISI